MFKQKKPYYNQRRPRFWFGYHPHQCISLFGSSGSRKPSKYAKKPQARRNSSHFNTRWLFRASLFGFCPIFSRKQRAGSLQRPSFLHLDLTISYLPTYLPGLYSNRAYWAHPKTLTWPSLSATSGPWTLRSINQQSSPVSSLLLTRGYELMAFVSLHLSSSTGNASI